MSAKEKYDQKHASVINNSVSGIVGQDEEIGAIESPKNALKKDLKSRHMQMIAIGGAIGAILFISSGAALQKGGPAPLMICFFIIGFMLLFTMQALSEMAVLYPVSGAFFSYVMRFVDPSWGFAIGWNYAIAWLTVLPFELTAASLTIQYWRTDINVGVWITFFLVLLSVIQIFGVRGYGEVEFVLSMIKITACVGFIIFGIIVDCGGIGHQGYLGVKYWHDPGAFKNGFNGICAVFTNAAIAFGGTELVGLAAAESANPIKAIPLACKQVFFRILFFYVLNLFILGLIVRSDDPHLFLASSAATQYSPFVIAITNTGVSVLPSIFNAVITVSVISVANSCTFASTRTIQALAERGMAPKHFAYVDKAGRPIICVALQLSFGLLAFIGESAQQEIVFEWLLSLTGLTFFFTWSSICVAHIRFRFAWKAQGYSLDQIPYKPALGIWGSVIGLVLNIFCFMATFYSALYPHPWSTPSAEIFFQQYLTAIIVFILYFGWKSYSHDWRLLVPLDKIDLKSGLCEYAVDHEDRQKKPTWKNVPTRLLRAIF